MEIAEIINFWFSARIKKQWFSSTPELDKEIKKKYEHIWEQASKGKLDHWQNSAEGALALIIVLDQFPRNMYRGKAKSFKTARQAVETTLYAIKKGFDKVLDKERLGFLFIPLMHSEKIEEQDLSVKMYRQHNLVDNIKFAEHHRSIVQKYGRFPHRNVILGRKNTQAEEGYLLSKDKTLNRRPEFEYANHQANHAK